MSITKYEYDRWLIHNTKTNLMILLKTFIVKHNVFHVFDIKKLQESPASETNKEIVYVRASAIKEHYVEISKIFIQRACIIRP